MKKLEADYKLIIALKGEEPAEWARRDNGDLVYLNQQYQKFVLTDQEIQRLTDKALLKKAEKIQPKKKTPPPMHGPIDLAPEDQKQEK